MAFGVIPIFPVQAQFPASNFPTWIRRNNRLLLAFDDTTAQTCYFPILLPSAYNSGGLTVKVHYSMTSATSGDVDCDVAIERIGDQQLDVDSDSFAAANVVDNTTVPSTSGLVDVLTITFTDGADMDSLAAGEYGRISVSFDSAGTASGDIELHLVTLEET